MPRLTREMILEHPAMCQVFEVTFLDEFDESHKFITNLAGADKEADENAALNLACDKVEKKLEARYSKETLENWMHVETKEII